MRIAGEDTSRLETLLSELEQQRNAQAQEMIKAKTTSALVATGKSAIAARLTAGRMSVEEAGAFLTSEQRAGILTSTQSELDSVISSDKLLIQSNFSLITSNGELIDSQGNLIDSNGNIITKNNELIDALNKFQAKLDERQKVSIDTGFTPPAPAHTFTTSSEADQGLPSARDFGQGGAAASAPKKDNFYIRENVTPISGAQGKKDAVYGTGAEKPFETQEQRQNYLNYAQRLKDELKNDPKFRAEEFARASAVIANPNISDAQRANAQAYLTKVTTSGPIIPFETGGFTGNFDGGKLAVLHEKELVLNKLDTKNILDAVKIMRSIPQIGSKFIPTASRNTDSNMGQNITINAEFPNVSSADEIKKAFASMSSRALQYAYRTKSY
jgi:hypothetical protein